MAEKTDLEKCNFRNFRSPVTLTLTLDRVIWHTVMHHSSTSIYTLNFIEIGKTFCEWTDGYTYVPTDGRWTDISPSNVLQCYAIRSCIILQSNYTRLIQIHDKMAHGVGTAALPFVIVTAKCYIPK